MLRYNVAAGVACITMDNPPVNGLSVALRAALVLAFRRAADDIDVRAVVLSGNGRGFSAGGDIREFGTPAAGADPALSLHVHPVIEEMRKPVVAALHGLAVGGGLETALVCHYRVVEANTRIGFPEVNLGTIPLSGTQRLPRLMPLPAAIDLILSGELVLAEALADTALFDCIVPPGTALHTAMAMAQEVSALPLARHRTLSADDGAIAAARKQHVLAQASAAHLSALDALEAAYCAPDFDSGMRQARALYGALMASHAVSEARDRFFARPGKVPAAG